jgi:hypothetical protein
MVATVRYNLWTAMVLGAVAGPAAGEGVVTLAFQGAAHEFRTSTDGARAGFARFAAIDAVSFEGEAGPARLVVELSLPPDAGPGTVPLAARVIWRPDGFRDYWVSPPGVPPGAVRIDRVDLRADVPEIAGAYRLPLCPVAGPLVAPAADDCPLAEGRFAVTLARE